MGPAAELPFAGNPTLGTARPEVLLPVPSARMTKDRAERLEVADPYWLSDEHLGVAATLAHVDEIIGALGEILFDYQTAGSGIVQYREALDGGLRHLVVDAVKPIPEKVPLLAADALNTLRAALEHTIYIEAVAHAGAELDEPAAKLVEMPAAATYDKFLEWAKKRVKNGPAALHEGAELYRRIYDLQPLHRYADPVAHPLARLVAYTNHAKHRTPAVTAVRIPVVSREDLPPTRLRDLPKRPEVPIEPGDVVFTAPADQVTPLALFPTVGINVPGTERWPVLMIELDEIAVWVRKQAIPRLITGSDRLEPEIPAWYDISRGCSDRRAAVASGTALSASHRSSDRLHAAAVRVDMVSTIAAMPDAPAAADVRAWLESLPDSQVLDRMRELVPSLDHAPDDMLHNWGVLERMRDDAVTFSKS